jgi:integrase
VHDLVGQLTNPVDSYSSAFVPFLRYCGDSPPTLRTVRDYFQSLNAERLSASSVCVRRFAVKKRVRAAARYQDPETRERVRVFFQQLDEDIPAPKKVDQGVDDSKLIDITEYRRMVGAATPRQCMMLRTLWKTGLRVSEMTAIRLEDCRVDGERVHIRVLGKCGRERTVRIARSMYQACLEVYDSQALLFETADHRRFERRYVSRMISELARHSINRHVSVHALRHSFITYQAGRGRPLDALSSYVGHASLNTTKRYLHNKLTDGDLELEDE